MNKTASSAGGAGRRFAAVRSGGPVRRRGFETERRVQKKRVRQNGLSSPDGARERRRRGGGGERTGRPSRRIVPEHAKT